MPIKNISFQKYQHATSTFLCKICRATLLQIIKQFCSVSHCSKTGKTGRESYSLREQRKLTFKLTLVKLASPFEMQSLISEYISSPTPLLSCWDTLLSDESEISCITVCLQHLTCILHRHTLTHHKQYNT